MRKDSGFRTAEVAFAPGLGEAERRAYLAVPDTMPRILRWLVWLRRGVAAVAVILMLLTLAVLVTGLVSDAGSIVDDARNSGKAVDGRGENYVAPVIILVSTCAVLYLLRQAKPHLPRAARILGDAHRRLRRRGWRDEALDLTGLPPRPAAAIRRMQMALAAAPAQVADQALWDTARRALASVALRRAARARPDHPDSRAAMLVARQLANQVVDDADALDAALGQGDRQWVFPAAPPEAPVVLPEDRSLPERTILARRLLPP